MRFWLALSISLILFGLPQALQADTAMGFLYARSDIAIRHNRPPPPLPWSKVPVSNPPLAFDVEIRDADSVYNPKLPGGQTGWYNVSSPDDRHGVMVVFRAPMQMPLSHSTEYEPLDVLFVDSEGTITEIIPALKLSELDHDILPSRPVRAFLFLQGGICQGMSINPGDHIEHSLFKKSTLVINTDHTRVIPKPADTTSPAALTPPLPMMPDIRRELPASRQ